MVIVKKCKVHSQYQGKREPRTMCRECWKYFVSEQCARIHKAYRDQEYIRLRQQ